jgi:prephenate dehydratase
VRVGFLGPEGTFSHEALLTVPGHEQFELAPQPTNHDTVMAVHTGEVERALVPIENSLEGAVNAVLDALAFEAEGVSIVGELVHSVRYCLIARAPIALEEIRTVYSHEQAIGQCAHFIRSRLPNASVMPAASTADAVRFVTASGMPAAALSTRAAAELYGGEIVLSGVEDVADNETRFAWLAPSGTSAGEHGPWKTSLVFWGVGSEAPGWLVSCLGDFAFRGVNLTRIESRPRKLGLGKYMFFVDLEGAVTEDRVAGALESLRAKTEVVRVLGSYPAA